MAAILQVIGAAATLSSHSFDSKRFSQLSLNSLPERKGSVLFVRSDVRATPAGSNLRGRNVGKLVITNAVSAKKGASKPGHEVFLFEALREAIEEEMNKDPQVFVMTDEVDHYGGSYKVTKGLATKYKGMRVYGTPPDELFFRDMEVEDDMNAPQSFRCIREMSQEFLLRAFNEISNNGGMLHYTSGCQFGPPTVIRGPGAIGCQLGVEHARWLVQFLHSIPGTQMVACSTPYNAKGLMKAAIRNENPVILLEHVLLYDHRGNIPDEEYMLSLEEAEMVRPGEQVTILTYSRMRYDVIEAVEKLVNKGYDPEVIDIRSIRPFDLCTIGNSVKKTHRVLIVEECLLVGGIGVSLTAAINKNFHDCLDAPIMRLSSPIPYATTLEEWTNQIMTAVEQLCH